MQGLCYIKTVFSQLMLFFILLNAVLGNVLVSKGEVRIRWISSLLTSSPSPPPPSWSRSPRSPRSSCSSPSACSSSDLRLKIHFKRYSFCCHCLEISFTKQERKVLISAMLFLPEWNNLPVPRASSAAGSSPLLSITRLFSLFFISPLLGLVPWFVISWGWRATAASCPGGWSSVLTPATWSFIVVVPIPLVTRVSSLLALVLGFVLSVCSGVWPASGAASSTTIISVVAVEISAAVRCGENYTIIEFVRNVLTIPYLLLKTD